MKCPYCGERLNKIRAETVCGERWYEECFNCGYCTNEEFSEDYYFGDPDAEWDDVFIREEN